LLAVARAADRASGLVLAVFIARSLGASALGIYSAALAYYALLAPAGELGIVNLLVREIARDRTLSSRYLVHASLIVAAASTAAVGIFLVVVRHLGFGHEMTVGVSIVALALLPGTLNSVQEAVFIAHQRVFFQTYVTTGASLVNVGGGLYLLESGHGVVSLFVLFVCLEYAVTAIYFVLISTRIVRITREWDWAFARRFLREVRPFAGTSIVAAVFSRPEIIMLSLIGTAEQVGFYSAAFKVAALWNDVTQVFMANVFPVMSRLYEQGKAGFDSLRTTALRFLLAASLPLAVGTIVTAKPLTRMLYGAGFGPTVTPMRILALIMPLVAIQAVLWRVLSVRDQQGVVFRVQAVSVVARLALAYPLIVLAGVKGAAIAVAATFLLHTGLLAFQVKRDGTKIHLARLSWPLAAGSAVMGIVAWIALRKIDLWAAIPAAVATYVLLLWLLSRRSAPLELPPRAAARPDS